MHSHKKTIQKTQIISSYLTGVKTIFMHPSHFFFVLQCRKNQISIFDVPTMSIIATTKLKPKDLNVNKCIFMENPNIFYIATQTTLYRYQLYASKLQCKLLHKLDFLQPMTILEYPRILPNETQLQILTNSGVAICSIQAVDQKISALYLFDNIIQGVNVEPMKWFIVSGDCLFLAVLEKGEGQEQQIKVECEICHEIESSVAIVYDPSKDLISYIDQQQFLCIARRRNNLYDKQFRVPLIQEKRVLWTCFCHYGVETSTRHKNQHKIIIFLGLENLIDAQQPEQKHQLEQQPCMIEQNEEMPPQSPSCDINIFTIDLLTESWRPETDSNELPELQFINQLVNVKYAWYCEQLSNKLSCLTSDGDVLTLDTTIFLQSKKNAKQWVNLGYRFQALESNLQYEELEDEFERTAQQGSNTQDNIISLGITKQDLDDSSSNLILRSLIRRNKIARLNCISI